MLSGSAPTQVNPKHVRGWLFDVYPSSHSEITVWIIGENGTRIKLIDSFKPKVYVSGKPEDLYKLMSRFLNSKIITSWDFVHKFACATDVEKSKVLEVELEDTSYTRFFTREVLELGHYLQFQLHNCDLQADQAYLFEHNVFPLAKVEIESDDSGLKYDLLDSVESVDYEVPPLRVMRVQVDVAKKGKIANLNDPIEKIVLRQGDSQAVIDSGDERDKLLKFVRTVKDFDPDFVLTRGGDQYLFPYLVRRALINDVLDNLVLSREDVPLVAKARQDFLFIWAEFLSGSDEAFVRQSSLRSG